MSWVKNADLVFYCDYSNGDEWIFRVCLAYENEIYGEWPDGTLIRINKHNIWRPANVKEQKKWWSDRLDHYAPISARIQEAKDKLASFDNLKPITD
jgi:hypothetical protein